VKKNLPSSWVLAPLAEIACLNPGVDKTQFAADDELPFVPMPAVEAETGRIDVSERRPFSKVRSGFTSFASGDVLFAKITPCMENGKMAIVPPLPRVIGFGSTEFHVLRPSDGVDKTFLYYFVSSSLVRNEAQRSMSGAVGQKRVPRRFLETKELPLPPLNEQHRIVDKIDTLFTELDQGEAALRKVQALLARYRQSVLKDAVTGQLTADWRARNSHRLESGHDLLARILEARRQNWQGRGKYREPAPPGIEGLPELPAGWVWATVDQLAEVIGGLTKNSKRKDLPLRRPMLRVANVYQNRLELDDVHEIGLSERELPRVELQRDDILVVEGNGSQDQIGRMAIWHDEISGAVHQNHLIKIRMIEKGLVEFALWWFQSPQGRQTIEQAASSTSGLYTLSISKLQSLIVPVPSLAEAAEISQHIVECFSNSESTGLACESELTRSAALRQSILKDAFAGRLVPQDLADESASALLARIRAERAGGSDEVRRPRKEHA